MPEIKRKSNTLSAANNPFEPVAHMRQDQAELLRALCHVTGTEFDSKLTEVEAAERINNLRDSLQNLSQRR